MSVAEIAHRVLENVKRRKWKSDTRGWAAFAPGNAVLVFPDAFNTRIGCKPDGALMTAITQGNRLFRDGHLNFLGCSWPQQSLEQGISWFMDPVTGDIWPGAGEYCFAINHRHQPHLGDVKYVWELNRLQFLPALAVEERETPAGTPSTVFALVESWMEANPPFRGINWSSGIELALRIVAVSLASAILHDRMTDTQRGLVLRFLHAHAYWLHRFPSRFSSANNHLISEGLGMLVAGLVAPGLPGADRWRIRGREIMEEEAARQFHPDGMGVEQSPTYTSFSAEMMAIAVAMTRDYGQPLRPVVEDRLQSTARWLQTILDDNGYAERIGDDDEGRVIAWNGAREDRYPSSVVACLASLLARPDLAPPLHLPHLRDLFFDVKPTVTARSQDGLHIFPDGGLSIYRGAIGGHKALLCFDHGPLGYLSIAAHGHADALSLTLRLDDQSILADAGTYLYHAGREWRDAFRGTSLHNTLKLGGVDQSRIAGAFMWSHKANAHLVESRSGPPVLLRAEHDGYQKTAGVVHQRSVEIDTDSIIVLDTLTGNATDARSEINWIFHPDIELRQEGDIFLACKNGTTLLGIRGPEDFSAEIVRADEERMLGWYSPAFGERQAAFQLIFSGIVPKDGVRTVLSVGA